MYEKNLRLCVFCAEGMAQRFSWQIRITYGQDGVAQMAACPDCIALKLNEPLELLRFAQELSEFRKNHELNKYRSWPKEMREEFVKLLKKKSIPLYKYGIPLWVNYENGYQPSRLADITKTIMTKNAEERTTP